MSTLKTRWVSNDDGTLMPLADAVAEIRTWLKPGEAFTSVECRATTVDDLGSVDRILQWVWDCLADGECEVLHDHELCSDVGGPHLPDLSDMLEEPSPGFKALRAALAIVRGEVDMYEAGWVQTGRTATVTAEGVNINEKGGEA